MIEGKFFVDESVITGESGLAKKWAGSPVPPSTNLDISSCRTREWENTT
jgi:cation transport ATPase